MSGERVAMPMTPLTRRERRRRVFTVEFCPWFEFLRTENFQ